ncbi:P-loop containing nucleoside triphosphate hydrolase protein [Lipomyces orientalis]|uniref:P-loop containing nucleoside triphosphate hydrolase protein n=1 Tax=Lipomyces orientalis TaxID=1233043 RepID=A0ACC3TRJ3_9ASCO
MPSFRRQSNFDEDDDIYDDGVSASSESLPSSKRPRISDQTRAGHAPGAIVRVAMSDFVTYSKAEFHLGPSLNMIIGPNGTGKSTLVCAVCLGLGGKPELLARAKDVGEFVKNGQNKATIEIELQGFSGERNPIIERSIYKDNRSEWSLDGKRETAKNVKEVIDRYNVQIDNLCQFLPQDKVASFAGMTPQNLLIETERATGSPQMLPRHEKLKALHAEYKSIATSGESNEHELAKLKERQEVARQEVERFKERERLQAEMELLERYRPFVEYSGLMGQLREAKDESRQLRAELEATKARADPSLKLAETAKDLFRQASEALEIAKTASDKALAKYTSKWKDQDNFTTFIDEQRAAIKEYRENREKHKRQLAKTKQELEKYEEKAANRPDDSRKGELLDRVAENSQQHRDATRRRDEARSAMDAVDSQIAKLNAGVAARQEEIKNLEMVSNQKLRHVQKVDREVYDAVVWLRQNKHLFKSDVFEPPILTLTMTDQNLTDAIETVVHRTQMLTFTCLSREDYMTFTENVIDKRRLNVPVVEYSGTDHPTFDKWKKICSPAQLHDLHFDGFLLDAVTAPDPVLNMLCHAANIDEFAYSRRALSPAQRDQIERFVTAEGNPVIRRYISGRDSYFLNRSFYGNRAIYTQVRDVRSTKLLSDGGVDQERKAQLNHEIQQAAEQRTILQDERQKHHRVFQERLAEIRQLKSEKESLTKTRERMHKELQDWHKAIEKVKELKETVQELECKPDDTDENIAEAQERIREHLNHREAYATKLVELLERVWEARKDYVVKSIDGLKKRSDAVELKDRAAAANQDLEKLAQEVKNSRRRVQDLRAESSRRHAELESMMAAMTEEQQQQIKELSDRTDMTLDELDGRIAGTKGELESIFGGNQHVIEQYEKRQSEIERLQAKVDTSNERIRDLYAQITEIRNDWEPELDHLISRVSAEFSEAFRSIGCAGEVSVGKDEDYENWSIQIKVKFREHEQLQLLTHQRQSGGERSVSTIFYLMSLQCVTKAPFRVVDEINQGMDPRNERMVHARMVDVACQENASQYFLITPKLLPDLKYHKKMVVHCIYSGTYLPNPIKEPAKMGLGRLRKYAEIGRRQRQAITA